MSDNKVGVLYNPEVASYPKISPFHPQEVYPEYPFGEIGAEPNPAYAAVRQLFQNMGLDATHFGKKEWNPLGGIVQPGDRVLIKPNLVRETPYQGGEQDALMTHGSVIRAVADYVCIALQGSGTIIVADAPIQTADWGQIIANNGLVGLEKFYQEKGSVSLRLLDLRTEKTDKTYGSFIWRHQTLGGPEQWRVVDLGSDSALDAPEVDQSRLRAPNYDPRLMASHHAAGKHEYLINKEVLEADVVLNLAKLKTHRIGGLTCSMKNLVGILAHKSCLAHYSAGSITEGGDEYPQPSPLKKMLGYLLQKEVSLRWRLSRFLVFLPRIVLHFLSQRTDKIFEGSWSRNQTLWRMILDLNRAVIYADKSGQMHTEPQRRYFCLVDGLIAGEKNGPLAPVNKPVGVLLAGQNPVAVDWLCAGVMGFAKDKIPSLAHAWDASKYPLTSFKSEEIDCLGVELLPNLHFIPHKNWIGQLELSNSSNNE